MIGSEFSHLWSLIQKMFGIFVLKINKIIDQTNQLTTTALI